MGLLLKLRVLLWKNMIVRRRNKIRFILEAVYPLVIFAVIASQDLNGSITHFNECHFAENALPSAGQVPFLHSMLNPNAAYYKCLAKNGTSIPSVDRPVDNLRWSTRSTQTELKGSSRLRSYPESCDKVGAIVSQFSKSYEIWEGIETMLTSKILYYPETTATRKIMQEVNNTFNAITTFPPSLPVKALLESPNGMQSLQLFSEMFGGPTDVRSLRDLAANGSTVDDAYQDFLDAFEKCVDRQKVEPVSSESALDMSWKLLNDSKLWALVSFDDMGEELKPLVKYNIRMNDWNLPSTQSVKTRFNDRTPSQDIRYITNGFAYLQDMIDSAILSIHTGRKDATRPGKIFRRFPTPAYDNNQLATLLQEVMPLLMVIAWVYTFSQTVKGIVVEKEERVKEVLAVMGVSREVQSAGWVVEGMVSTFLSCLVLSLIIKFGGIFGASDVSVLLVLLVSSVLAMQSFALFVATFFSRPTLAGPCSGVIYFLTYYVFQLVRPSGSGDPSAAAIISGCLVSNVALAESTLIIAGWEIDRQGAQWSNIFSAGTSGEPMSLAGCIGMMWLDAVIYALLAWYMENVFPGEYGVPKHYLFFLKKSYWFSSASEDEHKLLGSPQNGKPDNADNFEPDPQGSVVGVAIENLSKVFGKQKPAVNNLTLNFHQDQINCFLGHNGAGKTTTISMLTGMYPPTAGTARLFGRDIRTDMDAIRTSMGVCPQHNVLFGSLTVKEHLLFFGRVKGISDDVLKKEIDYMLHEMGLEDKRNARSSTLSGGMKRKLSVGIAFVGGSKVVFLDEPTAGVDPFSRRGIWELLLKFRQGRTIILTTHFMDEADILGDRIAIVSEGQLQCCGSSVFLKERLGTGYHLTVEWKDDSDQNIEDWRALVTREVLLKVPAASRVISDGPEDSQAVFVLPDRHDVAAITALLEHLDARRDALCIASYGVSDTSLEEIFLKVAENRNKADSSTSDVVTVEDDSSTADLFGEQVTGWRLLVQQCVALTRKRYNYVRRDPRALFTQLVLPAFFVTLALALSTTISPSNGPQPELPLKTDIFGYPTVSFYEQLSNGGAWGDRYLQAMLKDGVGFNLAEGDAIQPSKLGDETKCGNSPPNPSNDPAAETLPSGELFYSATGADVEDWIVDTKINCRRNRFGGFSFGAEYAPTPAMNQADNVKVWFNPDGYASAPVYLNAINNVILRASLPAGADTRQYAIAASHWPLPKDPNKESTKQMADTIEISKTLSSAITVIFAMSFVPASFVMYLVEERVGQSKHLQLVSGLRSYIYWLQSYAWDLVNFIVCEILVIIIFAAFQIPTYTNGNNLLAVGLLILTYGLSCTPLLYLFSWFFRIPSMAFLVLSTGNLFVGLVTTVTILVMRLTATAETIDIVKKIFLVAPQYCLGQGLMNMATNYLQNQALETAGLPTVSSLSWDVTGQHIVAMFVVSVVLAAAVFLVEQSTHWWHGFLQSKSNLVEDRPDEEDDVRREVQRVDAGEADQGMLVLKRITKRYSAKAPPAVAGVSFGVERGQCFGLLGLNGAGKTSIFKMLTGDTLISGGDALINGRSVRGDMDSVRRLTGYCPQFDALVPLLTVAEHLDLYASIHGLPADSRPSAVRRAIQMFDLEAQKDKQAKALSGGNKRKLSAAIALVGDPMLLYMDEPTTSMDPMARRFVWQRVRRVVAAGRSVLLTSHSMEECEALCERITIMVNGRLTCIGSPQHLKHKYGSGYMAVLRSPIDRVAEAQATLLARLPGTAVKEAHLHQIKLQIPPETPLVQIFRSLDEARRLGCVTDYSVSQTTLEDVFMQFAQAQQTLSSQG